MAYNAKFVFDIDPPSKRKYELNAHESRLKDYWPESANYLDNSMFLLAESVPESRLPSNYLANLLVKTVRTAIIGTLKDDQDESMPIKAILSIPIYNMIKSYNKKVKESLKKYIRIVQGKAYKGGNSYVLKLIKKHLKELKTIDPSQFLEDTKVAATLLGGYLTESSKGKPKLHLMTTGFSTFVHLTLHATATGGPSYYLPAYMTIETKAASEPSPVIGNLDLETLKDEIANKRKYDLASVQQEFLFNEMMKKTIKEYDVFIHETDLLLVGSRPVMENMLPALLVLCVNYVLHSLEDHENLIKRKIIQNYKAVPNPTTLLYKLIDELYGMVGATGDKVLADVTRLQEERNVFKLFRLRILQKYYDREAFMYDKAKRFELVSGLFKRTLFKEEGNLPELKTVIDTLYENERQIAEVDVEELSKNAAMSLEEIGEGIDISKLMKSNLNHKEWQNVLVNRKVSLMGDRSMPERRFKVISDLTFELEKIRIDPEEIGETDTIEKSAYFQLFSRFNKNKNTLADESKKSPDEVVKGGFLPSFMVNVTIENSKKLSSESNKTPAEGNKVAAQAQKLSEEDIDSNEMRNMIIASMLNEMKRKKTIQHTIGQGLIGALASHRNTMAPPKKTSLDKEIIITKLSIPQTPPVEDIKRIKIDEPKKTSKWNHTAPLLINYGVINTANFVSPAPVPVSFFVTRPQADVLEKMNVRSQHQPQDSPDQPKPSSDSQNVLPTIASSNKNINFFNKRILNDVIKLNDGCSIVHLLELPTETSIDGLGQVKFSECVLKMIKKYAFSHNYLPKYGYVYLGEALRGAVEYIKLKRTSQLTPYGIRGLLSGVVRSVKEGDVVVSALMIKNAVAQAKLAKIDSSPAIFSYQFASEVEEAVISLIKSELGDVDKIELN